MQPQSALPDQQAEAAKASAEASALLRNGEEAALPVTPEPMRPKVATSYQKITFQR